MRHHEQSAGPPSTPPDSGGHSPATSSGPARPRRPWAWTVPAGLVAGLLAWLGGEPALEVFTLTPEEVENSVTVFGGSDMSVYRAGLRRIATRNTALHYGVLGAAVGGALGLAGGLSRRLARGAAIGLGSGLVVGGSTAAAASLALVPVFIDNYRPDRPTLLLPFLVHGAIWTAVGFSGGLALGLGRRERMPVVLGTAGGGALGGLLGTVAYEVIVAVAFPLVRIEAPVPKDEPTLRALAVAVVALAVALGATWASVPGGRSKTRPAA